MSDFNKLAISIVLGFLVLGVLLQAVRPHHPRDYLFKTQLAMDTAPLRLRDKSGSMAMLSKFRGNWTVLFFWSTACADCYTQMKSYNQLAGIAASTKLKLVSLSLGGNADEAFRSIGALGYKNMDAYAVEGVRGIRPPLFVMLAPDGSVVGSHGGITDWGDAQVLEALQEYLKKR